MPSDYDKQQWQAEQAARDSVIEKQREKERKTRERAARNARRKLERLHKTLSDKGEITDFENEFGESVVERLDKFGSAFMIAKRAVPVTRSALRKKRVVAAMNKKVKNLKKKPAETDNPTSSNSDRDYERTADRWKNESTQKKRSSFKAKKKTGFTPRVRNLEDDMPDDIEAPYIPEYRPDPKKPFLRIVKNADCKE